MSNELQLDVCRLNLWRRHLVNAYEVNTWWKVMAACHWGMTLKVTYGLTACTLGSAPAQRSVTSMGELYLYMNSNRIVQLSAEQRSEHTSFSM